MTEHVHEWYVWKGPAGVTIGCRDPLCSECLTDKEAESMLNATERLSADAAWGIANRIYQSTPQVVGWEQALRAYANMLEGK